TNMAPLTQRGVEEYLLYDAFARANGVLPYSFTLTREGAVVRLGAYDIPVDGADDLVAQLRVLISDDMALALRRPLNEARLAVAAFQESLTPDIRIRALLKTSP